MKIKGNKGYDDSLSTSLFMTIIVICLLVAGILINIVGA